MGDADAVAEKDDTKLYEPLMIKCMVERSVVQSYNLNTPDSQTDLCNKTMAETFGHVITDINFLIIVR